jgi:hypothetical protein
MVASHLVNDEMEIFVTDVSPLCDELDVVMEMNSICDDRFWSWMIDHFCHNLSFVRHPNGVVNDICFLWRSRYVMDSPIFRHYKSYATLVDDVVVDMTNDVAADVAFLNDTWPN